MSDEDGVVTVSPTGPVRMLETTMKSALLKDAITKETATPIRERPLLTAPHSPI